MCVLMWVREEERRKLRKWGKIFDFVMSNMFVLVDVKEEERRKLKKWEEI